MKTICILGVLLLSAGIIAAADVNISGTVTQTGGEPIENTTITLSGVPGTSAETDSEGKFTLLTTGTISPAGNLTSTPLHFILKGNQLIFSSALEKTTCNIAIFRGNGAQLFSRNISGPTPTAQHLTLPVLSPGLSFLRISVGRKTSTIPVVQIGTTFYPDNSTSPLNTQLHLSKSTTDAIVDTLIVVKSGYSTKKTPVKSYLLSGISIIMDSVRNCSAVTLKEAGACGSHKILVGVAVSPPTLTSLVSREFNYVTAEDDMKWLYIEGSEGVFNFTQADAIVNWAQQNGIKVKGHCLVWHNQLPNWVAQAKGRDRVLGIMKNHIEKVMGHFGSKIYSWDVVNEAVKTDSSNGTGNAQMRSSVFYTEIGPDYIDSAYAFARNYADSHNMKDMKLYYNEYSIGADNDKSRFTRTVVRQWIDRGIPIDGIGLQMHLGPCYNVPTVQTIKDNLQYYADLGLEVLISELDINLCAGQITKEQQLVWYREITRMCVNLPQCVALTVWGVNDSESWLNTYSSTMCNGANSQSLLFDNNQKKETYTEVLDALNGK